MEQSRDDIGRTELSGSTNADSSFKKSHAASGSPAPPESAEANKLLSDSAVAILKEFVFERPAAPASTVVGSMQYRMSVVFELEPCGGLQHFDVPKDARISVCGSRLRGQ